MMRRLAFLLVAAAACARGDDAPSARAPQQQALAVTTAAGFVTRDSAAASAAGGAAGGRTTGSTTPRRRGRAPLDAVDFVVDGVMAGSDSLVVRAVLGRPSRIDAFGSAPPAGADPRRADWHYRHMTVHFTAEAAAARALTLHGRARATRRGLRVGHSKQRVRELYGAAEDIDGRWYYTDLSDPRRTRVIIISFERERVRTIFLGDIVH